MGRQWRERSLDDSAWRPPKSLARAARAAEQDHAAGSRDQRMVSGTIGNVVLASVYFRRTAGRRVYAYLRWAAGGRTSERFICEVERPTRSENLAYAWNVAHERRLLTGLADEQPATEARQPRASWASSDAVRRQMQANRSRDTRPELALRSQVHQLGLRYRVAARPLPSIRRTADLVFTRARVAVFVDGCFWHGCPDHHRPSQRNEEFWRTKINGNRERDAETDKLLEDAGWRVVRIWEHEEPRPAALRVHDIVRARQILKEPSS